MVQKEFDKSRFVVLLVCPGSDPEKAKSALEGKGAGMRTYMLNGDPKELQQVIDNFDASAILLFGGEDEHKELLRQRFGETFRSHRLSTKNIFLPKDYKARDVLTQACRQIKKRMF